MLLIHISLQIVAVVSELVTYHCLPVCLHHCAISYHESPPLKEGVWFYVCGHLTLSGYIAVEGIRALSENLFA